METKTKTQYAVKIGRDYFQICKSLREAKQTIADMEHADEVYDIPNRPRRKIVCREVVLSPWRDWTKKKRESALKLKPSAITVKVLGLKVKQGDLTITKGEVF